jgi:hypothetical protein
MADLWLARLMGNLDNGGNIGLEVYCTWLDKVLDAQLTSNL